MKILRCLLLASLPLLGSGCAVVSVKVKPENSSVLRRSTMQVVRQNILSPTVGLLTTALGKNTPDSERAAALLEAAKETSCAKPGSPEHAINTSATRSLLALMSARSFAPLLLPDGRTLTVSGDTRRTMDPRTADTLMAADSMRIGRLYARSTQEGVGLACVARFKPGCASLRGQPGIPKVGGLCEPVTALVRASGSSPQLTFYRTRTDDETVLDGRRVRLAADFSAPLALLLSKGRNRQLDIGALMFPDRSINNAGLYQFDRYDAKKIPVVFVHGLMSRPETWAQALNTLLADRQIRERYQFWLFLYPTGLPVWTSAAKLRSELDRYRQALDPQHHNGNFKHMVMVGHSMGGLITSLQIRAGGKNLWKQFMDAPPQNLPLSPKARDIVAHIVEFHPRPEIARVVFFSTPHRGSDLAARPFAEFFSRLIRLPFSWMKTDLRSIREAMHEEYRDLFVAPANSLVFLRARSPLLAAILKLPLREGIPYHSVIGDRGHGNTPNSSDGIVPYWSSHLEGANSEKIVPSGHGSHENPEGIQELNRILKLHLKQQAK